ncbi:chemotaxis protein CheB [Stakelama saccharophila]|uniref:protein-glutamate methylesterase n=1 Tax=Stakelama saccharophila TaxID=3075605 RepID=A0ABZ0B5W1_9SPHN|nr:chemotaxis protein CheB [Stakelama sp. W311]WNO52769.1 chemotaxis protein CheB [Stakelama sp. W311]
MNVPAGIAVAAIDASPAQRSVLIVDDSAVARAVLSRMVEAMPGFGVAGAVGDCDAAFDILRERRVDAILLDLEMPVTNGLTALPDLLRAGDGARILVVSSNCDEGGATAVQALALGAADTLVKPGIGAPAGRFHDVLRARLLRLLDEPEGCPPLPAKVGPDEILDFDIVAIGASTGGIHALTKLMRAIPDRLDLPILVTQHLPASFMPYFAAQLAMLANRPCEVAHDLSRIKSGRILVAPGNAHLRCVRLSDGAAVRLIETAAPSGCMPSVDPMLRSVADVYGARALAVILSGMGRDGCLGAKAVHRAGGIVAVQDQASSVVWGMPGSIVADGHAHVVLRPEEIGAMIARRRRPAC